MSDEPHRRTPHRSEQAVQGVQLTSKVTRPDGLPPIVISKNTFGLAIAVLAQRTLRSKNTSLLIKQHHEPRTTCFARARAGLVTMRAHSARVMHAIQALASSSFPIPQAWERGYMHAWSIVLPCTCAHARVRCALHNVWVLHGKLKRRLREVYSLCGCWIFAA